MFGGDYLCLELLNIIIKSKMIMQVHDELNFDVVPEELERVQTIVLDEMKNAYCGRVAMIPSSGSAVNWLEAH